MTTIAWDKKTLAVDSQITMGSVPEYRNKLLTWDGGYFTLSGKWEDYPIMKEYLNGKDDNVKKLSKDFTCIYSEGNKIYRITKSFLPIEETQHLFSEGSGWVPALTALLEGKTAVEALRIARKLDIYTGGTIKSVTLR